MSKRWVTDFVASLVPQSPKKEQGDRSRFDANAAGTGCYVYSHEDHAGNVFYVGKGTGRRAWEYGRDPTWNYYVETRLAGRYLVRIVLKDLSESAALEQEQQLMHQYGDQLINLQNMSRSLDMEALRRRDELLDRSRASIAAAKREVDPKRKIDLLTLALHDHISASPIRIEGGLFGEIHAEMVGMGFGNVELITLLVNAYLDSGDAASADASLKRYLSTYPAHDSIKSIQQLRRAVAKGVPRKRRAQAEFVAPEELPEGWERATEKGLVVIRLSRSLPCPSENQQQQIERIAAMERTGNTPDVIAYLKGCIVKDEGKHPETKARPLWLYPHYRAVTACHKQGDSLSECLFLARLIHHSRGEASLGDLEARLRRTAVSLARRPREK